MVLRCTNTNTTSSGWLVALTDLLLEQMQHLAPLDDKLAAFLRHDDLLGKAMLFFLHEQFRTDPRFEKTLTALQQETILSNQQVMLEFMKDLHLSLQVKVSDEFTRHDTETRTVIQKSLANLKHLPTDMPGYSRLVLMVGSATSSMGDLESAEGLFSQVIENTHTDDEKALAYFNRFQVRLRCKVYDEALLDLQAAIAINPEQYALHDVKTYPIVQLLGAGGMGCVFLCRNNNPLIKKQRVIVKCFWETLKGSPEEVFKEAITMRQIAGDYVPEPLYAGYTNVFKQERAFFVTEYLDGMIDGEVWLKKYGPMDLKTGCLQMSPNDRVRLCYIISHWATAHNLH
ncbi:Serine/Threonine protein kinase [Candidatus Thiomargarita nelsonii]|uniref:Serine/Threonine protein kinase n=1 Tax=Candidatus Thiomargarita nelsonii TaxID=1003181 RepID=A0A176RTN4_9GAMM|nr:Serine/Threonine protein kinase [Candidatus Thiomargarita nelsonii]